jgi:hypothetical protein
MPVLEEVVEEIEAPVDKVGEKLEVAAILLQQFGWVQHSFGSVTRGWCAIGVLREACGCGSVTEDFGGYQKAKQRLGAVLGRDGTMDNIIMWNDGRERTKGEVVAAFQAAARIK